LINLKICIHNVSQFLFPFMIVVTMLHFRLNQKYLSSFAWTQDLSFIHLCNPLFHNLFPQSRPSLQIPLSRQAIMIIMKISLFCPMARGSLSSSTKMPRLGEEPFKISKQNFKYSCIEVVVKIYWAILFVNNNSSSFPQKRNSQFYF